MRLFRTCVGPSTRAGALYIRVYITTVNNLYIFRKFKRDTKFPLLKILEDDKKIEEAKAAEQAKAAKAIAESATPPRKVRVLI